MKIIMDRIEHAVTVPDATLGAEEYEYRTGLGTSLGHLANHGEVAVTCSKQNVRYR